MKGFIFAAGKGTRLAPLTVTLPKPLVEVACKPLLQHVIERLKRAGVEEVVVNVHHLADQIERFLEANRDFGLKIHVSDERELLLDTGGGLLAASHWLEGEPFIAVNADILSNLDLSGICDSHRQTGADVTLLTSDRTTNRRLLFDEHGRMKGWKDTAKGIVKPSGLDADGLTVRAFDGVHVIRPGNFFPALRKYADTHGPVFSITDFYIFNCGNLDLRGYDSPTDYQWFDIGTPERLEKARTQFIAP